MDDLYPMQNPSPRRFFHFSYLRPGSGEMPHIHELRDGDAFAELASVLCKQGFDYSGLLVNYPNPNRQVSISDFRPSDLLVLTTRPPLNEDDFERFVIKLSGTPLEKSILEVARRYFKVCRRSAIVLSEEIASKLAHNDRGQIDFTVHNAACYRRYRNPYTKNREAHRWRKPESTRTAAFILLDRVQDNGPALLNVFSMDGPGTLIWCYLLRTKFSHLLDIHRYKFIMAELITTPLPHNPSSLSFTDRWDVDILVDYTHGT